MTEGAVFTSETDAEVIAHLVAHHYDGDLSQAVRAAYAELRGHYAFVAMTRRRARACSSAPAASARWSSAAATARRSSPRRSRRSCARRAGCSSSRTTSSWSLRARRRRVHRPPPASRVEREIVEIDWDEDTAEKQGYETFMLKEIHEQADAVAETIGERAARGDGDRPRD